MLMTLVSKKGSVTKFDEGRLESSIRRICSKYPKLDVDTYISKVKQSILSKEEYSSDQILNVRILAALDEVDIDKPDWTYVASHTYLESLYKKKSKVFNMPKYSDFYEHVVKMVKLGLYKPSLLESYSEQSIRKFGKSIDQEADYLFDYVGLSTLVESYLAKNYDGDVLELPQERFMVIAMDLMSLEHGENKDQLVLTEYWALSKRLKTVATPTYANAGKTHGQLSSCFIDVVNDDLVGIYDSNTDVARLSKGGGGIGTYLGKIRALGSDIKSFKGNASGIMPWMKQLDNTAKSVDQLGSRPGAISPYLDVWHRDIEIFLDCKLNNGDEGFRTHNLSPGVCVADIFMEKVRDRESWYLFDPHTTRRIFGWSLEDCYDEEVGAGTFRNRYAECIEAANEGKYGKANDHGEGAMYKVVKALDLMKKILRSRIETGFPYMFYRDTANRDNPNKHRGMIYSSNLCTEIFQNMSHTYRSVEKLVDLETVKALGIDVSGFRTKQGKVVLEVKDPGDFVVCNLSSISLAGVYKLSKELKVSYEEILDKLISIQMRALDNVIDLNTLEVLQARATNQKYRAVGLGTFGWHHLLALMGVHWETSQAVEVCDHLYENIAYYTIKASNQLAKEKGAYPEFEGSDWHTGALFVRRGYVHLDSRGQIKPLKGKERWYELCLDVMENGVRNGYMEAVAPNASTALLAGSTASIDPVFNTKYTEEKTFYKIPVVLPDLDHNTYSYYQKTAYKLDQRWSVRQNAARQRHIDQGISFNFYVPADIKFSKLLELDMLAWESGLKSTYYTRSKSLDIKECEWCAS